MFYESLIDKLLDEENHEVIELRPEGGDVKKFDQIAVVNLEGNYYAILHPVELKEDQVVVFKLEPNDEDSMTLVTDQKIANEVLEVYEEDGNEDEE